jgi:hypothetical protein
MRSSITATDIVERFLKEHGSDIRDLFAPFGDPGIGPEHLSHPQLTAWAWRTFSVAPTQATIATAYATLRALAYDKERV